MRNLPNEPALAPKAKHRSSRAKALPSDAEASRDAEQDISTSPDASGRGEGNTRRCILSGDREERDGLIRLALGPDGSIAPDVRARAPGRGAWIAVDRATLDTANAKGKLKGALARAFKTGDLAIPADLGERIAAALKQDMLSRIGLESRSGAVLVGSEKISEAARKGQVHLLLHAADAAADGSRKLDQSWRVGSDAEGSDLRGMTLPVDRTILSGALGRENAVHVAIVDRSAAERIRIAIGRWRDFIGSEANAEPCANAAPGSCAVGV